MASEGKVRAWKEAVVIPTYEPAEPDRNPMFLHRRVYQGSTGKVYPLPFVDRISTGKTDHTWQAVYIENEFLKVMILPEIGGRIHAILDKTNGYDAIYRQEVIKPALVGLAGPWISGGIEFNWPQHHRPSTFMPADVSMEEHADGSVTVWLGEHEPMNRMKGMHGVCLHPGRSYVEVKARLYNRTQLTQTFLWWANVATKVHELYQSFFPPDVYCVADHAKRAISRVSALPRIGITGWIMVGRGKNGVPSGRRCRGSFSRRRGDTIHPIFPGMRISPCRPAICAWAHGRIFLAAMITPLTPASFILPITTSRRGKSSGRGGITNLDMHGIAT